MGGNLTRTIGGNVLHIYRVVLMYLLHMLGETYKNNRDLNYCKDYRN